MENAFLKKLTEVAEANLGDSSFGVDELARKMGLSYSSLRRRVSTYTGKSANQFIREIRLRKAFEILQQEEVTTAEVAYRTGFSSPNYFNSCFHEYFGYPPGELKRVVSLGSEGVEDVIIKHDVGTHKCVQDVIIEHDAGAHKYVRLSWIWVAGAVVMLVVAGAFFFWNHSESSGKKKSIAVLPFKNLNNDSETQRFCSGFEEQLRNELCKLEPLDVRSRISADKYKNPGQLMPEIGIELNVDYTIQGTVTREADSYTVWVYLYETKTDNTLWSNLFTRQKEGLFELEVEIVNEISMELKAILLPEKIVPGNSSASNNPEAEKLFSQGNFYSDLVNFKPMDALRSYLEAVSLDPRFARAYLGIAFILNNLYSDIEVRRDSMPAVSRTAIENAFVIQPGLSDVHEQLGLLYHMTGDFTKSLAECSIALKTNPDSPETYYTMAGSWLGLGKWIKAEECLKRVLEKNVYSILHLYRLGATFEHLRDYPRAEIHYREAAGINPLYGPVDYSLVDLSLKTSGDPARARVLLDTLVSNSYPRGLDYLRLYYQYALLDLYEGKYQEAVNRFSGWQRVTPTSPPYYCRPKYLVCAMAYGLMNKPDPERQYYDSTRIFLEGLQQISAGNRNDPRVTSALGIAYAGLGLPRKAAEFAEKVKQQLSEHPDAFLGPYAMEDVAYIYTKTGNYADALKTLRQLLSEPGPLTVKLLELDPRWSPLKDLPDFNKLISSIGTLAH